MMFDRCSSLLAGNEKLRFKAKMVCGSFFNSFYEILNDFVDWFNGDFHSHGSQQLERGNNVPTHRAL